MPQLSSESVPPYSATESVDPEPEMPSQRDSTCDLSTCIGEPDVSPSITQGMSDDDLDAFVSHLPYKAQIILYGNWQSLEYDSEVNAEMACICSLYRKGLRYDDIERLFNSYPGTGNYQELRQKDSIGASWYLRASYDKAIEWLSSNNSPIPDICEMIEQWIWAKGWPGRTGSTDRAVYIAHIRIVERAFSLIHAASVRDIAIRAGVGPITAGRSSHRLCRKGLLKLVEKSQGGQCMCLATHSASRSCWRRLDVS